MNEFTHNLLGSHVYWKVQNTGWSGGVSWFETGGYRESPKRFSSEDIAITYAKKEKAYLNQETTLWRVVHVIFDRYETGEVTTKTWVEI